MREFFQFLISKAFWLNLLLFLAFITAIVLASVKLLDWYTGNGKTQLVPDLKGMTVEQAEEMLKNRDLRYEIMDSTYKVGEQAMTILEQEPPPNAAVKKNRKIYFTINAVNPPKTAVPEIVGIHLSSAEIKLESKSLIRGDLVYKPYEFHNTVLSMSLAGSEESLEAGTMIPKGSVIDLVVGDGFGNTKVAMPDLRGNTLEEALVYIRSINLVEGEVFFQGLITDTAGAYVLDQSPTSTQEKKVKEGTMVDLWVQQAPPIIEEQDTKGL